MTKLDVPVARVFVPLLQPDLSYLGAYGGRASAKSIFFAEHAITRMMAKKTDVVALREVQKSITYSIKREVERSISKFNLGDYFDVIDKKITHRNGGVMIFEGMQNHTAESVKSLSGFDIALLEEAQSFSQLSLDTIRPTIMRKPGAQIWAAWNPKQPTDAIDRFFRGDEPPPKSACVRSNYTDNPWLPDETLQEIEYDRRIGPVERFNHIWLGAYQLPGEALVFRNWRTEEFDTPAGTHFRFGADWGFSIDPSVLVRCYSVGRTLYIDQECYQIGCEIDKLPDLFMSVPESERWAIIADSARPETISYMQRHGFPRMQAALKGAGSVEEGIQFMQSMEIVVHPRCKHTIQELSTYSYKIDKETGKPIPILSDKNNHVIDALRYANEGARRIAANNNWGATPIVGTGIR